MDRLLGDLPVVLICRAHRVGRQRHALGPADVEHFSEGGGHDEADHGVVPQLADRLARRRRDPGIGGEQDELHPKLGEDLVAQSRETSLPGTAREIPQPACCACRRGTGGTLSLVDLNQ